MSFNKKHFETRKAAKVEEAVEFDGFMPWSPENGLMPWDLKLLRRTTMILKMVSCLGILKMVVILKMKLPRPATMILMMVSCLGELLLSVKQLSKHLSVISPTN